MQSNDIAVKAVLSRTCVLSLVMSGCLAVLPAAAQTSLPQIDVQRAPRSSGATVSQPAGESAPASESAPVQENAFSAVQGYLANRSATGTKTDTPIGEIPQSITVVTADEIRDQGAKTVQESLRYVPGAFADAYGPDSRGDYPRVRGSDPNIYLDGTQAINAWLFNEWRPDPYTLSRVEVLRGPASVLYGATSTAGIINMVSKLPQAQSHNEIELQYGSFDRKQVQFDSTGKLTADGQWLYRVIGVFRDANYQTDLVKDDRILIQPAITWKPTNATTWTLLGFYQKDTTGSSTAFLPHYGTIYPGPTGGFIPVNRFASEPGFDKYQTTTGSVSSLFEHVFSENFKIRQNSRYMHTNGKYFTMYPDNWSYLAPWGAGNGTVPRSIWAAAPIRDSVTSDTNAEFKFDTGVLQHKVLAGFDYRYVAENGASNFGYDARPFNLFNPVYFGPPSMPLFPYDDTQQIQAGVYVQDQIRLGQLIVVVGSRHDKLTGKQENNPSQTDTATTSRVGVMYELPGGLTPYVSWAQSFNPIFGANICEGGGFCKPKRGELQEVGFKYSPYKGLAINGALYDIVEKNREAYGTGVLARQIGEVSIKGGEIEVVGTIAPGLDIMGGYSYTDAVTTAGDNVGSKLDSVPLHMASLWLKQKFSMFGIDGFSIGGGARYIGKSWSTGFSPYTLKSDGSYATATIETPSFMLYDAMFAWEDKHWRFQINVQNIGDTIHVTTCLARGDCFYGARRTVLSSLIYKF